MNMIVSVNVYSSVQRHMAVAVVDGLIPIKRFMKLLGYTPAKVVHASHVVPTE